MFDKIPFLYSEFRCLFLLVSHAWVYFLMFESFKFLFLQTSLQSVMVTETYYFSTFQTSLQSAMREPLLNSSTFPLFPYSLFLSNCLTSEWLYLLELFTEMCSFLCLKTSLVGSSLLNNISNDNTSNSFIIFYWMPLRIQIYFVAGFVLTQYFFIQKWKIGYQLLKYYILRTLFVCRQNAHSCSNYFSVRKCL